MNETILTPQLARQVLFLSFFHSQGSPNLQQALFEYIALRRPQWRLTQEHLDFLLQLAPSIEALVARGIHVPFLESSSAEQELQDQVILMRLLFERSRSALEQERVTIVTAICRGVIFRDYRYLVLRNGRQRQGGTSERVHHDPHLSFFCHYVLHQHTTGCQVFDELYAEIAESWNEQREIYRIVMNPLTQVHLTQVIHHYNRTHPHHPVSTPLLSV